MRNLLTFSLLAGVMVLAMPAIAHADPYDHGPGPHSESQHPGHWHEGDPHRSDWYFHPRWQNGRYVYAPVPPPVTVVRPYYYAAPPAPVLVQQEPALSINIGR